MARYVIRVARRAGIVALFVGVAVVGTVSGVLFASVGDLPEISALDDYQPNTITRVLARNGEVISEFATERRVIIGYEDIGTHLRQAIISAEDAEFDSHVGFSISRIIVTVIRDVLRREMAGASTLTQQLARNVFPIGFEKTWERKIKEMLLAIQIEKRYTKREILELYANQIYLGHGAHGVEAAARLYFDKSAKDLALEEAALIAGIIQTPSRQSPFVDLDRAMFRRNYVLQQMAEEGYVTAEEAEAHKRMPIDVTDRRGREPSIAPYFVEEIRQHLEATYGAQQLYESGLSVRSTLDPRLQAAGNSAVRAGLRQLDKRRGFRRPAENVLDDGGELAAFEVPRWRFPVAPGDIVPALVTAVGEARIDLRIGRTTATIDRDGYAWTRRRDARELVRPGDVVEARILEPTDASDAAAAPLAAALEQEPEAEGALIAIENRTGQVLAMVGGYSFDRSKFNRAVQASRQIGSLFKAIIYTTAIDRGYTPTAIIEDQPVSFPAGPDQPNYEPRNYDQTYEGEVTLRYALEKSRNVPAVILMDQLGIDQVLGYARRFGFTSPLPPFLSVALGAAEATLMEVTSAYSVFPNRGVRMEPYLIMDIADRNGKVLEESRPVSHEALRPDTAYVMTSLLRGVVQRGTGVQAARLSWPLAGKTGTVDDYTDGWFVGFDPEITVGVWVGHDQKRTLGPREEGARVALPIWVDFMRAYIDDRDDPPEFSPPGNIVFLAVDRSTGAVVEPATPGAIRESFISGTQPGIAFED